MSGLFERLGALRSPSTRLDRAERQAIAEAADKLEAMQAEIDRLNAECERWIKAYQLAHDQAMANGASLAAYRGRG